MIEFTQEEVDSFKRNGWCSPSGVTWHEELWCPGGMGFALIKEPGISKEQIDRTKA